MLTSIINISEEPQFPLKVLLSAKKNLFKKQSEDCFISTRFIEFIIGKFYDLEAPFIINSIKEVMINEYSVLLINNAFLLFIKEYIEIKINLDFVSAIKNDIDIYARQKKVNPVCVFITYENFYLNGSRWLSARTGVYLLDRKEIADFFDRYILKNNHWLELKNKLFELENCTTSINVHERFVYRQAAEGFFMRLAESLNSDDTHNAEWYYSVNNELTLTIVHSEFHCKYSITIINTGVFKTYINAYDYPVMEENFCLFQEHFKSNIELPEDIDLIQLEYSNSEENYLFELTGIDWKSSESEIYERLDDVQKTIYASCDTSE